MMSMPARNRAVVMGSQLASTRLTNEAGAVASTHDELVSPGTAQMVTDGPATTCGVSKVSLACELRRCLG
jgi:hypothetical protein